MDLNDIEFDKVFPYFREGMPKELFAELIRSQGTLTLTVSRKIFENYSLHTFYNTIDRINLQLQQANYDYRVVLVPPSEHDTIGGVVLLGSEESIEDGRLRLNRRFAQELENIVPDVTLTAGDQEVFIYEIPLEGLLGLDRNGIYFVKIKSQGEYEEYHCFKGESLFKLIKFVADTKNKYIDSTQWANLDSSQLLKTIHSLRLLFSSWKLQYNPFSTVYPVGHAINGEMSARNRIVRQYVGPISTFGSLEHKGELTEAWKSYVVEDEELGSITLIIWDLNKLKSLDKFPLDINQFKPYLLILKYPLGDTFVEITARQKEMIEAFNHNLKQDLSNLNKKEQDTLRKSFGEFLTLLRKHGVEFKEGTGLASRSLLVFPVIKSVSGEINFE